MSTVPEAMLANALGMQGPFFNQQFRRWFAYYHTLPQRSHRYDIAQYACAGSNFEIDLRNRHGRPMKRICIDNDTIQRLRRAAVARNAGLMPPSSSRRRCARR